MLSFLKLIDDLWGSSPTDTTSANHRPALASSVHGYLPQYIFSTSKRCLWRPIFLMHLLALLTIDTHAPAPTHRILPIVMYTRGCGFALIRVGTKMPVGYIAQGPRNLVAKLLQEPPKGGSVEIYNGPRST